MQGRLLSAPSVASSGSITARGMCQTLVQAFISSRLDYCNALLYGISDFLIKRLQSIQNAAARFPTGANRRDHISPVLRSLHRLPVKQWVDYKLATLVYKSLRGQASSYLVDDCQLIADSGRPQLRSAHTNVLTVPRLSLIHIWRCRRIERCRSRWSPYH